MIGYEDNIRRSVQMAFESTFEREGFEGIDEAFFINWACVAEKHINNPEYADAIMDIGIEFLSSGVEQTGSSSAS